jgi:hypothetical protein
LPFVVLLRIVFSMNTEQNYAFSHLLSAWRRREEARATGEFRRLSDAHGELVGARADMRSTLSGLR